MNKSGRPKVGTGRNQRLGLSFTKEETIILEQCSVLLNKTKTDTIVEALELLFKKLNKKGEM